MSIAANVLPLAFKYFQGGIIDVSPDGRTIQVRRVKENSDISVAFSTRAIGINEKICFRFKKTTGSIRYGFCRDDPGILNVAPSTASASKFFQCPGWSTRLSRKSSKMDDIWYYYADSSGDVHIAQNGQDEIVYFSKVNANGPLWAIILIDANTALEFVDPNTARVGPPARRTRRQLVLDETVNVTSYGAEDLCFQNLSGRSVILSEDSPISQYTDMSTNIMYSNRPMVINEMVCLSFSEIDCNNKSTMEFGFTRCDSESTDWMVTLERDLFKQGNILHFFVNSSGDVQYGVNGKDIKQICFGIDTSISFWATVQFHYNCTLILNDSVRLLRQWVSDKVNETGSAAMQGILSSCSHEQVSIERALSENLAAFSQQCSNVQARTAVNRTKQKVTSKNHQTCKRVITHSSTNTASASSSQSQTSLRFHSVHGENVEVWKGGSRVRLCEEDTFSGPIRTNEANLAAFSQQCSNVQARTAVNRTKQKVSSKSHQTCKRVITHSAMNTASASRSQSQTPWRFHSVHGENVEASKGGSRVRLCEEDTFSGPIRTNEANLATFSQQCSNIQARTAVNLTKQEVTSKSHETKSVITHSPTNTASASSSQSQTPLHGETVEVSNDGSRVRLGEEDGMGGIAFSVEPIRTNEANLAASSQQCSNIQARTAVNPTKQEVTSKSHETNSVITHSPTNTASASCSQSQTPLHGETVEVSNDGSRVRLCEEDGMGRIAFSVESIRTDEANLAASSQQCSNIQARTAVNPTKQEVTSKSHETISVITHSPTNTASASSSQSQTPSRFHSVHGETVEASNDGSRVRLGEEDGIGGIAFSVEPIRTNEANLAASSQQCSNIQARTAVNPPKQEVTSKSHATNSVITHSPTNTASASSSQSQTPLHGETVEVSNDGSRVRLCEEAGMGGIAFSVEPIRTNEANLAASSQQCSNIQARTAVNPTKQEVTSTNSVITHSPTNTASASSSQSQTPLRFHSVHGENVKVSYGGSRVRLCEEDGMGGIAFSARPIRTNEAIFFRILEASFDISFGFTRYDPIEHDVPDTIAFQNCLPPGYWVSCLGDFSKRDNIFYFYVSSFGEIHVGVNGRDVRAYFTELYFHDNDHWAFVEIWGDTVLEFIDSPAVRIGPPAQHTPQDIVLTTTAAATCPGFYVVQGEQVKVLNDGVTLQSILSQNHKKGRAFSNRPIRLNEMIHILFVNVAQSSSFIDFGFTKHNPTAAATMKTLSEYRAHEKGTTSGYWITDLKQDYCITGNILHFHVNALGNIQYGINGTNLGIICAGVETKKPLWAVVHLCSNNSTIKFVQHRNDTVSEGDKNDDDAFMDLNIAQVSADSTDEEPNKETSTQQSAEPSAPPALYDTECIICTMEDANTAFSCGHICTCYECAKEVWKGSGNGRCPICRAKITQILRTYR